MHVRYRSPISRPLRRGIWGICDGVQPRVAIPRNRHRAAGGDVSPVPQVVPQPHVLEVCACAQAPSDSRQARRPCEQRGGRGSPPRRGLRSTPAPPPCTPLACRCAPQSPDSWPSPPPGWLSTRPRPDAGKPSRARRAASAPIATGEFGFRKTVLQIAKQRRRVVAQQNGGNTLIGGSNQDRTK